MKGPVHRPQKFYEPDGKVLTEFLWDRSRLSVIQGPIGSGTSSCCVQKLWLIANEQAPDYDGVRRTRWAVSRETQPMLDQSVLATTWPTWFPAEEWGQMKLTAPKQHVLRRRHFSGDGTLVEAEVNFLPMRDEVEAERILSSNELTGFFFNEGQFSNLGLITELLARCQGRYPSMMNGPGASWTGGFIDLNAPEEGHWIPYMRGDIPLPPDWDEPRKAQYVKPKDWTFFVQPPGLLEKIVEGRPKYFANPAAENQKHLKVPYLEMIAGWDKEKIDRRILNKVGLSRKGKPVYPTFSHEDHVLPMDKPPQEGFKIIVGLDFGRDPAALFAQLRGATWHFLSELIGDNESAERFAPRVARHLATEYPGFLADFWGDPRGADGNQVSETTAYDVFRALGMNVRPATTDNNPEMRRSTMERVLSRRRGLQINPKCLTIRTGFASGYYYRAIKGVNGMYTEKPEKNMYSHIVEAGENAILGGGEGEAMIRVQPAGKLRTGRAPERRFSFKR